MSRLSQFVASRPVSIRRPVLWTLRTSAAGFVTGLLVGLGISVLFAGAPWWAFLLAWGLGSGIGLAAGLASGAVCCLIAVLAARQHPLERWSGPVVAFAGTVVGTYLVLSVVYGFDQDPSERGFVVVMTLIAGLVSSVVNRHTDTDAWYRERPR